MKKFKKRLVQYIDSKRIIDDPMLCYAYGTDASLYRIVPQLVVIAQNNNEIQDILKLANKYQVKITFRAAGTSLSGQALTNQVLVVLSNMSWQNYKILEDGQKIILEPGIIGAHANLLLKKFNTKIGPDPGSINSCKIGGIAANNSSGMCCGITKNTYNTLHGIKIIFANGAILDTNSVANRNKFISSNKSIIDGIISIREQILGNSQLVDLIKHKFKIKNTSGYTLNSFLDFSDPIEILSHLLIGSEGTLGFISEITYNCVPDNPHKAVSLIFCENLGSLISLTNKFAHLKIDAIELMDITSLNSVKDIENIKNFLPKLEEDTAAILVEVSGTNETELTQIINEVEIIIDSHPTLSKIKFTTNTKIYNELWDLRRGILPTIGAARKSGSSVVTEDIAVDINQLASLVHDLRNLFSQYNYQNAAIFGHVLSGNIHFVFTPKFDNDQEIENYKQFMYNMCNLVAVKYAGSLKAEHGSGRNIAPFAELEWGKTAYSIMWQIKRLLDPNLILNPDVKLTQNPNLHLENLKQLYPTDPEIDKCIECGFCETVCPSKNLTLTPRQRIATYRKMNNLLPNTKELKTFSKKFKYNAIDTCATTGMCKTVCPVGINTGKFILKLRKHQNPKFLTNFKARHFANFIVQSKLKLNFGNFIANILGRKPTYILTNKLHNIIPIFPVYLPTLPETQSALFNNNLELSNNKKKILYFPTCNNRIFGDTNEYDKNNPLQQLIELLGYEINYPKNLNNLCCGQVFSSNGNPELAATKSLELKDALQSPNYQIIMDNSSCLYSFTEENKLNIIDSTTFICQNLDKLNLHRKYKKIALHIDCSSKKIGNEDKIRQILEKCTDEIITPINISCCGFAGDKGLTTPELNQTALYDLKNQIHSCDIGVTFNRNCQIGLSFYGHKTYLSLPEIILNCLV